MSVLIKNMEKPKSCYEVIDGEFEYCPFVNADDDCILLLKKGICEGTWEEQYSKCPLIENLPPVQPERKKGEWIKEDRGHVEYTGVCSECGFDWIWHDTQEYFNFCPNCGAPMRKNK